MQGGENKMASQRRLNRDLSCLCITYFPYQDNIRILPDNGPKSRGKCKTDLGVYLHLANATDPVFDGVFDCDDINIGVVDTGKSSV